MSDVTDGDTVHEVSEPETPESGRVELPRGHWVEVVDPWTITEAQRNAMMADNAARLGGNRSSRRQNAGLSGTAPQKRVESEDPRDEFLANADAGHGLLTHFITAWGGPLLDGKPVSREVLDPLPAPLYVKIDEAVTPVMREVFPRRKQEEDPTEP